MLYRIAEKVAVLPRRLKSLMVLLLDFWLCAIAVWAAFYLRLGDSIFHYGAMLPAVIASWFLSVVIFIPLGLYRTIFRHIGYQALISIANAMLLYSIVYALLFVFIGVSGVPRTVGFIQPLVLFALIVVSRAAIKNYIVGFGVAKDRLTKNVLIYGTGRSARMLANAIAQSRKYKIIGMIADSKEHIGTIINSLKVYDQQRLTKLIKQADIEEVLVATSNGQNNLKEIIRTLEQYKVKVKTLPPVDELADVELQLSDLKEIQITDVLGRTPVEPDDMLLRHNVSGKVVLVTGAGGSIGSELCRQIMRLSPTTLILFEQNEFSLYSIERELCIRIQRESLTTKLAPILGSVIDKHRLEQVFRNYQIDTVFHAAAYKHVPIVEENPGAGVRNNIFGTKCCADVAGAYGVANFVLISTDKAVRPTNTMGATKRFAELIIQAYSKMPELSRTKWTMVRFGNVLGSSGSVVPLFTEQIKSGGPITVTHPEIIRYFMTIPEAAQLVIQASVLGHGGDVMVLDMGEAVKIVDLAKRMIHLSGLELKDMDNPDGDIEIKFTGLRPGEKLYEELLIGDEMLDADHPRIMRAKETSKDWHLLESAIKDLDQAINTGNSDAIRSVLMEVVDEYSPQCSNMDVLKHAK